MPKTLQKSRYPIFNWLVIMALVVIMEGRGAAQTKEYAVKAAFLEKFTRFIQWPENVSADSSQPFILGVLGENPFGSDLEHIFSRHKIINKSGRVRYLRSLEELDDCQLVFISRSMANSLDQILELTRDHPILTVADTKGFAEKGVHINLYHSGNTIRFEVNVEALRRSGLQVSYLLLNLARIVPAPEEGE